MEDIIVTLRVETRRAAVRFTDWLGNFEGALIDDRLKRNLLV